MNSGIILKLGSVIDSEGILRHWIIGRTTEGLYLFDVVLVSNISDKWVCLPDIANGYVVRGAYDLLLSCDTSQVDTSLELVWYKQVPLKVSIFACRLIRDRLPTKANPAMRGAIAASDIVCVSGCGHVETTQHLFLSCTVSAAL